ncbi:MAG: alkaline phosphatase D family protein [Salibacteraceae bacterium]
MRVILLSWFMFSISLFVAAQHPLLQSGPMNGYSEMREVLVWVQTKQPAAVQLVYWLPATHESTFKSATVNTLSPTAFTAKLIADQVEPGNRYNYALEIDGERVKLPYSCSFESQPLWQHRTDPPAFTCALGSCSYINEEPYDRPGKGYGGDYQIFESIHKKSPNLMLWMGDNIYFREADWYSRTGMVKRYTHTRSTKEMQPLLASTHHFAVWDDHDFGPNNSNRSFIRKDLSYEIFKLFWGNPTFGVDHQGGVTSQFLYYDIEFFLLDNRYFRTPNRRTTVEKTILGQHQIEWLIDALKTSRSPFKMVVIGGQFLNSEAVAENYANLKEERQMILDRIKEEQIHGVIFLTGDRHHSELSKLSLEEGLPVYDLTVSPLTAGSNTAERLANEPNANRVEGTLVTQRNFGLLSFSGPFRDRKMLMEVFDSNGELLWKREVSEKEM